ncbi:MAG: hypothetical protein ACJA0Z_001150, partial [Halioglobus sp.]
MLCLVIQPWKTLLDLTTLKLWLFGKRAILVL